MDKSLLSLLDLPREIRFDIYKQLFRSIDVRVHIRDDSSPPVEGHNYLRNTCTSFMTVSKLISKEATPIFFGETSFYVEKCECWNSEDSDMDTTMPPIQNLIIGKDMSDTFLDRHEGIGAVLGWLKPRRRDRKKKNSLVCQPIIHEDEDFSAHDGGLRMELGVLINEMPACFRKVEFTFCACLTYETNSKSRVKIMAAEQDRNISIRSVRREEALIIIGVFGKYGHQFKNVEWVPDTGGSSTEDEIRTAD